MSVTLQARLDAHAIQAHMILIESSQEGEVERNGDYVLGYTGAALPSFNSFVPLTLTGLTDETLADAAAFFNTRDTMYAVSLEEHRVPDGTEYLSKRRYQPLPPQPIMVLDTMPASKVVNEQLIVEAVSTVPAMTAFYSVLESVYDYTTEEVMLLFPMTQLQNEEVKHFAGYADGVPVTIATAVYAEDIVSIWNLSTLDDHRGQGFASALLNHILVDARENHECDASLIYATPMGFSLFGKLDYKFHAIRQLFLPQELG
ncbi:MAG: GNAT family N-acetyltransferase [Chloroflexota bacterium]